jgi:hypothetical protein
MAITKSHLGVMMLYPIVEFAGLTRMTFVIYPLQFPEQISLLYNMAGKIRFMRSSNYSLNLKFRATSLKGSLISMASGERNLKVLRLG